MKNLAARKKRLSFASLLLAMAVLLHPFLARANPEGGVVAAGQANIITTPAAVDIHQISDKAVIDWRGFDIAPGERTEFHQPSASAIALNRVNSNAPSSINGMLKANGNVIVVNQNGVLFGRQAVVDVNGLVATSADTSNAAFMNESTVKLDKPGNPDALVSNQGSITARESGLVGFVAPRVENSGVITARLGRVQLAGGEKATLDFYGDGLLEVAVGDEATQQLVRNTGTINAQGGTVALTASAGRKLLSSAIEASGSINAQSVSQHEGKIIISAEGKNAVAGNVAGNKGKSNTISKVTVGGTLDASGKNANQRGGSITITGDEISLNNNAALSATGAVGGGTIHIGGDYLGQGKTPVARTTTIERGAVIDASATRQGHGGEVIVFADADTIFNGLIYANGAGVRGNGGFVETSGLARLHIAGMVEAKASVGGKAGTWLLDPADITITAATNTGITGATPFTATNTASQLSAATLVTALNAGTNVTVQTTNDGFAGNGDIFVNSAITSTGVGALTISAFRDIVVNAAITLNGGALTLRSDNTGAGAGAVTTAAAISTNGGAITIGGGSGAITAATYNANGSVNVAAAGYANGHAGRTQGVTIGGAVNAGNNGSIIINGRGFSGTTSSVGVEQLAGSAVTATGTGSINISGINQGTAANATQANGVVLRNNVTTQNGAIQINGQGGAGTDVTSNAGVLISSTGGLVRSTGSGTITVSGVGGASTGGKNYGVLLNNTGSISPTGGGSILIYGRGGNVGPDNTGVALNVAGTGSIVAATSPITINGFGGASTDTGNHGVALNGGGGLTATGGAITLNGTGGGTGASSNSHGIFVTGAGATISKSTTGAFALTGVGGAGTGGTNHGVFSNVASGIISTGVSNLSVRGTAGAGTASVGIASNVTNGVRTSGSGILTLFANSFNFSAANAVNSNTTLGVVPLTAVTLGLGTGAGVATIDNASLANIIATAGYVFGSVTTSDITVNTTAPFTSRSLNFTSAGNITFTNAFDALTSLITSAPTGTTTFNGIMGGATAIGPYTGTGRDLVMNANMRTSGNFSGVFTRDVTVAATATLTNGAASTFTLNAANGVITGTAGALNLLGNLNLGSGAITMRSAANGGGTRYDWTATASNFVPQSTFGPIDIRGFRDMTIDSNVTSNGAVTLIAIRDLVLNATRTLTNGAATALSLQAGNGTITGTNGALLLNGNLSVGNGTVTLRSSANAGGVRPSWSPTITSFSPQTSFGALDVQGFQDMTLNRAITSTGNITIVTFGDLNVANALATGAAGALTLQAANNAITGLGNLNLTAPISVGTGALTLRSGANGTRPDWTMNATNLVLLGATVGAVDIRGFLDTVIDRNLPSSAGVTLIGFRNLTLNAARTVTSGAANGINIQSANGATGGAGILTLNGNLRSGTGALTIGSGNNAGVRPDFTANATNLVGLGATFGAINIQGFNNFTVDRLLNSSAAVTIANNTLTTLRNNITSTSGTIDFTTNPIVVAEGFSPTISTVNNAITLNASTITDTVGGATEGLTISAGTGTITSNATINGVALNANGGSLALTGVLGGTRPLGNSVLTATTAAQFTLPTITALSLNAASTAASSRLSINAPITTTGASGLTLTSGGFITKTGAGNLSTVNAPLTLTAASKLFFDNAGTNLNSGGGLITLNGPTGIINSQSLTINSSNGNAAFNGPVVVGAPLVLNLGSGAANFSSTINGATMLPTFDVLLVGAGGGGGGADTTNAGGGGGSGAVVDTRVNTASGSTYIISVGGGGGGGLSAVSSSGGGAAGANGGAVGGNAGAGGFSGGGGGGGGFSGITIGGTFYGAAGGGAGGGAGNEGTANNVQAPGGGTQPNGTTVTNTGGAGANFTGDGGGGGGGGGGFLGGNGQTNLLTSGQASGGSNYFNPANASGSLTSGNAGTAFTSGFTAGGATTTISAPRTTYYQYVATGAGGNGAPSINGTAGGNGITIIRYTGSAAQSLATGNFTTTTVGSDTIITYSSGVSNSFTAVNGCSGGGCNLTINAGNVNFGGNLGGTTPLGAVTINATNPFTLPSLSASSLAVTGGAALNGTILINNGPATFNSPITVSGNSSIATGTGLVTFAGTVNGANNLTVDAAGVSLGGAIGGTTPLASLAITTTNALDISQNISAASILARTTGATSDITIAAGRALTASGAGNAITLASGQNFVNNSGLGLGTMNLTGGGRYLIYSTTPGSDTQGGLVRDFRRFSCSFAAAGGCLFNATINNTVSIPATGNGFIYSATQGTITLTISSIGNVIYGNSVNLVGLAHNPTTLGQYLTASDFAADVISGSITGSTTYVPGPANGGLGTYNIDYLSGALVSQLGYDIAYVNNPTAFTVVPRTVTASLVGVTKVYDQTSLATLAGANYAISNVFAGDVLSISNTSGTYDNKNAGTGKTVTVTGMVLTGAPVANYVLSSTTAANNVGTITPRALVVSASALNKIYDGNTLTTATLSDNRISGDVLTAGYTAANFTDKNVGTGKTVNVTGISLSSTDAGNYSFNTTAATTANITPRALTISATGIHRIYDGLLGATVTLNDDRVSGDVLTTGYTAANFTDKNVGNAKPVNVTGITLGSTDALNYTFNATTTTTANITPRALTISATGINRIYDGLLGATVTLSDDRVAGDVLTTGYTAANFTDKNVGNAKPVNVTGITLGSTDAGNYSFNTTAATTANITPRALTISASALNKIYDGNTLTTATLSDDRVAGDVLTTGYTAANFADKNAGTGKTVNVTGITLGSTDAGNYTFNTSASTTADINQRGLIVTANPQAVIYGTTAPAGTLSYSGFIVGEDASFLATAPTVASGLSGVQNAGTYAGNYTASGGVDGNYSFSYVAGNLMVLGKILNVTADTQTIEYGSSVPAGTLNYSGFITGENATFLTTAPSVGSVLSGAQAVGGYANNFTASGGVSGNYIFNYVSGDLIVTRKNLNVSADNKSINFGVAVPVGTLIYSGFVPGEDVTFLTSAPSVGSTLSGIQNAGIYSGNYIASGGVSSNYAFIYTPGTLTVNPAGLNVTVDNRTVTYGTAVPTSSLVYTGFVAGEDETFLTTLPTIASTQSGIVDAGTYTGNYTASGGVSGNYTFNYIPADLTVTPKALNVTVGSRTVTYGTAVPTSSLAYTGFIAGQDETFLTTAPIIQSSLSGVQNVGTYAGNFTASGGASNNYTFNYVAGNLVVGRKDLVVTPNPQNITYGTPVPAGTLSYAGFIPGENVTFLTTAPTVGSTLSGIQNAGTYAGNYTALGGVASNYSFIYNTGDLLVSIAPLTITANPLSRVYGAANSFNGFVPLGLQIGETVGSVAFNTNAAVGGSGLWRAGSWVVTPSAASGGTFSPSNYSITYQTGAMTISPRALVIGATGSNRVYDGLLGASVSLNDNRVGGDVLMTGYAAANFTNKNVGSSKPVTVTGISLIGADAGNYSFNTSATTTANITPRALVIGATGSNRVYNGLLGASVSLNDNRVGGDVLTTGYAAANFTNKNVGNAKPVTVTGISLIGADAGNYSFNTSATTTANITPRALVIGATGIAKTFDGTTAATVLLDDNRVAGDILIPAYAAASFASSLPATGIVVTVSGITLGGVDAGNYSFNSTALTTADISGIAPIAPPLPPPVVEPLPSTVVKVTQDPNATVDTPVDDGIYATPTGAYLLVFLPANAALDNKIQNRAPLARTGAPITTAFLTPDEEKRLRAAKTKRPRPILAARSKSFLYDANIPAPRHLGGFGASPYVKSI